MLVARAMRFNLGTTVRVSNRLNSARNLSFNASSKEHLRPLQELYEQTFKAKEFSAYETAKSTLPQEYKKQIEGDEIDTEDAKKVAERTKNKEAVQQPVRNFNKR